MKNNAKSKHARRPKPDASGNPRFSLSGKYLMAAAIVLILIGVAFVRIRLLSMPLERDEGEYAYIGQSLLKGIPPYQDAYNMKFPGTYFMYALIMKMFGETIEGIHLGVLLINLATIGLLFASFRKITTPVIACYLAAGYAFMSLSPATFGFAGHATHFVLFFALAGFFILLKAKEKDCLILHLIAGFLLGLAPMMKQAGVFFCLWGGLILLIDFWAEGKKSIKTLLLKESVLALGGILPFLLTCFVMKRWGVFEKFWFWTITYAYDYINEVPLSEAWSIFKNSLANIVTGFGWMWILAGAGLIVLFFSRLDLRAKLIIISFTLCGFLSVCPGFYFRNHYFLTWLPSIALLAGVFIDFLWRSFTERASFPVLKWAVVILALLPFYYGIETHHSYLFTQRPAEISKNLYWPNPFVESLKIADYIKRHTNPSDKIAVIGSEPQIYFYAGRRSASGFIYTYNLMELQPNNLNLQKQMVAEIEKSAPKYLVFVHVYTSWLVRANSPRYIFDRINQYIEAKHYTTKSVVDIGTFQSNFIFAPEVADYTPQTDSYITVLERP
jgi:4-amino-4-deoxy-L-arabinose transferase-like glycosyltransferase